jgi:hypothetical protein
LGNRCEPTYDTQTGRSARRRFDEPAAVMKHSFGQIFSDERIQVSRSFSSNGLLR